MRPKNLYEYLVWALQTNEPTLITGAPGVGKTDIVTQACRDTKTRLILSHPVVSDPTDYKGMPAVVTIGDEKEAMFLPFGDLKELIDAKERTCFLLDDLGQAPGSVQASAMQLPLARRINGHVLSDDVIILAATNRREDKAGVQGILEPVKSRFCIQNLDPDEDDWISWANKEQLPAELIAYVRWRKSEGKSCIYNFKPTLDMTNSPNPRNVARVGLMMNSGLPKHLEYESFAGRVGEGWASEFCSFLKMFRSLPDPDETIKNPEKASVPKEPSVMFALLGALVGRCKTENFPNIVKFSNRISNEFSVMLIKDCVSKNTSLAKTQAFVDWSIGHKDIIT